MSIYGETKGFWKDNVFYCDKFIEFHEKNKEKKQENTPCDPEPDNQIKD